MAEKFYHNCKLFDARCPQRNEPKMQKIITEGQSLTKEGKINYDDSPSDKDFEEARKVCSTCDRFEQKESSHD